MNTATIVQDGVASPAPTKSWRERATQGALDSPPRILVYGEEKVGKSTFAKDAPGTLYITFDDGTNELEIKNRVHVRSMSELRSILEDVIRDHDGIQTVVADPINWAADRLIEEMLAEEPGSTINEWGGGYGSGYREARRRWRELRKLFERVWAEGLGVVFIAHRMLATIKDPEGQDYNKWVPAIPDEEMRGLIKQWVDCIGHAHADTRGVIEKGKKIKTRGTGEVTLQVDYTPGADAGNRWTLPAELPLSWDALIEARAEGPRRKKELLERIEEHLKVIDNAVTEKKTRAALADGKSVVTIENMLASMAEKKKEQGK